MAWIFKSVAAGARCIAVGISAAVWAMGLGAQNLGTNAAHFKVNAIDNVWRVAADATTFQETYIEREALSATGAMVIGKFAQIYNSKLGNYEVLEAYTLKADGRKIQVSSDGFQVQKGIATGLTGVSWRDVDVHQTTFPDLQVGDKAVWRARQTIHTSPLPGWAAYADFAPPGVSFDKFSIRLEAPKSLGLQVFFSGFDRVESANAPSDDAQRWHFELRQPTVRATDDQPANTLVNYPRVFASSYKNHAQMAQAFAGRVASKAAATDEVKRLAAEITQGRTSTYDKAAAVYDWMRKNIRYVAIYIGTGGWEPHDVDWILSNRYGDCKDHVLLMQALLKAQNIEAVPVLVNTINEYELPEQAIGFDHTILYLPDLQLFADPTDERIPFGSLPFADSGKPVAVALASGAVLMKTPLFDPTINSTTVRTKLHIARSGQATGSIELDAGGYGATELQDRLVQIPAGMGGTAIQKILESSRLRGRGFARWPAVQRDVQKQTLQIVDLEIVNLLTDPTAGAIAPHPALNLPMYIQSRMGNYAAPQREDAMLCTRFHLREEFELSFDPAFTILRVPTDLRETHPDGIAFEAHYSLVGNTIKGWRSYTASQPRHVCTPSDYSARREVMDRIAQHLRSTVLYSQ